MVKIIGIVIVLAILVVGLDFAGVVNLGISGKAANMRPDVSELSAFAQGDAFFSASQYEQAVEAYTRALSEDPNHASAAEARYRLGKCYEGMKDNAGALRAYKDFVSKHPQDDRVRLAQQRIELLGS